MRSTRMERRTLGKRILDILSLQPDREFDTQAFLEDGTRVCTAYLVVHKDVTSIQFKVSSYCADLDGRKLPGIKGWGGEDSNGGTFSVNLPTYDPNESRALFLVRDEPAVEPERKPGATAAAKP